MPVLACTTTPSSGFDTFFIYSQQEIDSLFQGCVNITYPIVVGQNYSGSFVLPNTTTSVWELRTYASPDPYGYTSAPLFNDALDEGSFNLNLTSVIGNSVTSMTYLSLIGAPSFTSSSFPKLTNVASLTFQDLGQDLTLDFSSLQMIDEFLTIATPISTCACQSASPHRKQ